MALFFGESWGAFTAAAFAVLGEAARTASLPSLRGRQTGLRADTGLVVTSLMAKRHGVNSQSTCCEPKERQAGSEHFMALESVWNRIATGFAGMVERSKRVTRDGGSKCIRTAGRRPLDR